MMWGIILARMTSASGKRVVQFQLADSSPGRKFWQVKYSGKSYFIKHIFANERLPLLFIQTLFQGLMTNYMFWSFQNESSHRILKSGTNFPLLSNCAGCFKTGWWSQWQSKWGRQPERFFQSCGGWRVWRSKSSWIKLLAKKTWGYPDLHFKITSYSSNFKTGRAQAIKYLGQINNRSTGKRFSLTSSPVPLPATP